MNEFIAPGWRKILNEQGLDFDALWTLDLEPLDEPNTGRGQEGWSFVSSMPLQLPDGNRKHLILKRQQNHFSRSLLHPFRGVPTFQKEMSSILRYKKLRIPALEPVFFATRHTAEGLQAVLITEHLKGYTPLDVLVSTWQDQGFPSLAERHRLIKAIAAVVCRLHEKGQQHNCLYPRHLLIRQTGETIEVKLIDLEKSKRRPFGNKRRVRDLESLHRRAEGWSTTDRLRFLKAYCATDRLDENARALFQKILKRNRKKRGIRKT